MRARVAFAALAAMSASLSLSSCGTVWTRAQGSAVFGAYPFEAVAVDVRCVCGSVSGRPDTGKPLPEQARAVDSADRQFWAGLLSLPFDLAIDAVLAPIDLVAWAFGEGKGM